MTLGRPIKRHVTGKEVLEKSVTMCQKIGNKFYHTQYYDPDTSNKGTLYKSFTITDGNNQREYSKNDFVPIEDGVYEINYLIDIANKNPDRAIVRWGMFLFNNQKEFNKRFNEKDSMKGYRTNAPSKKSCPVKVDFRKML